MVGRRKLPDPLGRVPSTLFPRGPADAPRHLLRLTRQGRDVLTAVRRVRLERDLQGRLRCLDVETGMRLCEVEGMTRRSWPRRRGSARAASGGRAATYAFEAAQLGAPFRFCDCRHRFASNPRCRQGVTRRWAAGAGQPLRPAAFNIRSVISCG